MARIFRLHYLPANLPPDRCSLAPSASPSETFSPNSSLEGFVFFFFFPQTARWIRDGLAAFFYSLSIFFPSLPLTDLRSLFSRNDQLFTPRSVRHLVVFSSCLTHLQFLFEKSFVWRASLPVRNFFRIFGSHRAGAWVFLIALTVLCLCANVQSVPLVHRPPFFLKSGILDGPPPPVLTPLFLRSHSKHFVLSFLLTVTLSFLQPSRPRFQRRFWRTGRFFLHALLEGSVFMKEFFFQQLMVPGPVSSRGGPLRLSGVYPVLNHDPFFWLTP